jgi:hypothetical protein
MWIVVGRGTYRCHLACDLSLPAIFHQRSNWSAIGKQPWIRGTPMQTLVPDPRSEDRRSPLSTLDTGKIVLGRAIYYATSLSSVRLVGGAPDFKQFCWFECLQMIKLQDGIFSLLDK